MSERGDLLSNADEFMKKTDKSKDAEMLLFNLCSPNFFEKITYREEMRLLHKALVTIAFVASILTRSLPKKPTLDVTKSKRRKQTKFFDTGFKDLLALCNSKLKGTVPEGFWTDDEAADFLRNLESIDPDISRLFTKVFDDLIDYKKDLDSEVFNSDFFSSLSEVVRPYSVSEYSDTIVQKTYGLNHHYRYPMTSRQLFDNLHQKFSTV
jgi:hypothetical protein